MLPPIKLGKDSSVKARSAAKLSLRAHRSGRATHICRCERAATSQQAVESIPAALSRRGSLLGLGAALVLPTLLSDPAWAGVTTVFVAGASGATGKRVVKELRNQGLKVRAGVRDIAKAEAAGLALDSQVKLVEADVTKSPESLAAAIGDAQAVICAIGYSGRDPKGYEAVDYQGTVNLVDAAKRCKVRKFVLMTSLLTNGAAVGQGLNPAYVFLNLFGGVLSKKLQAELYLRDAGLDYTIVRPGGLSNKPPEEVGNLVVGPEDTIFARSSDPGKDVSRDQVAQVLVQAVLQPAARNRVVEIVASKKTPALSPDKWQLLDSECDLRDLLAPCLRPETSARRAVGILMFGDSVARHIARHACDGPTGKMRDFMQSETDECGHRCTICSLPHLHLALYSLWGVGPEGPYHANMRQPSPERIQLGIGIHLFKLVTGREPDLVVFSSNFWDISLQYGHNLELQRKGQGGNQSKALPESSESTGSASDTQATDPQSLRLSRRTLLKSTKKAKKGPSTSVPALRSDDQAWFTPQFLRSWVSQAAELMDLIKRAAPNSVLAYHTLPFPTFNPKSGGNPKKHMGHKSHVAQLNAAGRQAASQTGFHVVDLELMTSQFWKGSQYLHADGTHPSPLVGLTAVRVYLNLIAEHVTPQIMGRTESS
ncbi:hypothetical protein WJX72_004808 [[Myrmecia] bisecta]|uniref:NAD(P)-binding domain-containing protein n=1 Tax=[Myrmecia] bisecta TaxID=41462 RepID=A0AAW1QEZ0_9CHLO